MLLIDGANIGRIFEIGKFFEEFFRKKITPDSLTEVRDYQELTLQM
jgi:hypothetical protein